MCGGSFCTSAVVPQVPCGGIWPFGDLTIGAHQLALVLVPCRAAEPTLSPTYDPQSTDRWEEPVHQAPHVTAAWGDLGAKLWTLPLPTQKRRGRNRQPEWQWIQFVLRPRVAMFLNYER
jgi:hypothetical protein